MDEPKVQSIMLRLKLPDGTEVTGYFMGEAFCSDQQWEEIKKSKDSIGALFDVGDVPILIDAPRPLSEVITDRERYRDIVDMIREELRREHHEELKSKE